MSEVSKEVPLTVMNPTHDIFNSSFVSSKFAAFFKKFNHFMFFFDDLEYAHMPEYSLKSLSIVERLSLVDHLTFSGWYNELKRFVEKREISERAFTNMRPIEFLTKARLSSLSQFAFNYYNFPKPNNLKLKDYLNLANYYSFLEHVVNVNTKLIVFENDLEKRIKSYRENI